MALQFDSVLLYGLNKYAINMTDAQIATPGPYNDFEHSGLPAGPDRQPATRPSRASCARPPQLDLLPHRHRRQVRVLRDPASRQ